MIRHGQEPFLECSTKGDKRFSAFCARIKGAKGKSIEDLYQASKVFKDGSTGLTWREAKGKQAVNMDECTEYYKALWTYYTLAENYPLLIVLKQAAGLSDIFGQEGRCCQATVLWDIRNKAIQGKDMKVLLDNAKEVIYKVNRK
jgi:hypothetical protein